MGGLKTVQCACDLTPQSLPDGKSDCLLQCIQGSQGAQCRGQTSGVASGTSTQPHPGHSQILSESESSKSESQTLCSPVDSPWNSTGQNTGVGSLSLLQWIFPTQDQTQVSPALQVNSLPAEPQGKPKNTGVGSLSLLQRIFLTQGSNLPHCRWILYQLSHHGRPEYPRLQVFPFQDFE